MIKQKHLASTSVRYFRQFTLVLFLSCINIFQNASAQEETKSGKIEKRPGMSKNVYFNLLNLENEVDHITNAEDIVKTRIVAKKNSVVNHVLRIDDEPEIVGLNAKQIEDVAQYSAIVFSDYDKGFLSTETCGYVCKKAKNYKIPVFVDTKKKDLSCFS